MDLNTILFVIPTLYHSPYFTKECVDSLINSTKHVKDFRVTIAVVTNEPSEEFDNWEQPNEIIKLCSYENFNISKAINTALASAQDVNFTYFCYVDEGMRFKEGWLEEYVSTYGELTNPGILGARAHTTFRHYHKVVRDNLWEVLWTDGIMFTEMSKVVEIGDFDTKYRGDVETQDYCYRMKTTGNYLNYLINSKYVTHEKSPPLNLSQFETEKLKHLGEQSRTIFNQQWGKWRESKYIYTLFR